MRVNASGVIMISLFFCNLLISSIIFTLLSINHLFNQKINLKFLENKRITNF